MKRFIFLGLMVVGAFLIVRWARTFESSSSLPEVVASSTPKEKVRHLFQQPLPRMSKLVPLREDASTPIRSPYESWGVDCPAAITDAQSRFSRPLQNLEATQGEEEMLRISEGLAALQVACGRSPAEVQKSLNSATSFCKRDKDSSFCSLGLTFLWAHLTVPLYDGIPAEQISDPATLELLVLGIGLQATGPASNRSELLRARHVAQRPYLERLLAVDPQSRYGRFADWTVRGTELKLRTHNNARVCGERYLQSLEAWLQTEAGLGTDVTALESLVFGRELRTAIFLLTPQDPKAQLSEFMAFRNRREDCGYRCLLMTALFEHAAGQVNDAIEALDRAEALSPGNRAEVETARKSVRNHQTTGDGTGFPDFIREILPPSL